MSLPDRIPARPALPDCDTARAIRERAGWSQRRLADAIGVAEQTILRWEFGRTAPFGPNLARYADILDQLTRELANS